MNEIKIPAIAIPPEVNDWVQLTASDATHAANQVYTNPWVIAYDDDEFSIELLNQTLETKTYVQVFVPHSEVSFASAPATVPAGNSLRYDLKTVFMTVPDLTEMRFYVRWKGQNGVNLIWPLTW